MGNPIHITMLKKIALGLLVLFILLQFYRPARNRSAAAQPNDISQVYPVPANIQTILDKSCNDCHSNNTNYPWYTEIQPVGIWTQNHVNEGKEELNFSEFKTYTAKRQAKKMHEVVEMIEENEMPLNSYLWIHGDAKLNAEEKTSLIAWAKGFGGGTSSETE